MAPSLCVPHGSLRAELHACLSPFTDLDISLAMPRRVGKRAASLPRLLYVLSCQTWAEIPKGARSVARSYGKAGEVASNNSRRCRHRDRHDLVIPGPWCLAHRRFSVCGKSLVFVACRSFVRYRPSRSAWGISRVAVLDRISPGRHVCRDQVQLIREGLRTSGCRASSAKRPCSRVGANDPDIDVTLCSGGFGNRGSLRGMVGARYEGRCEWTP